MKKKRQTTCRICEAKLHPLNRRGVCYRPKCRSAFWRKYKCCRTCLQLDSIVVACNRCEDCLTDRQKEMIAERKKKRYRHKCIACQKPLQVNNKLGCCSRSYNCRVIASTKTGKCVGCAGRKIFRSGRCKVCYTSMLATSQKRVKRLLSEGRCPICAGPNESQFRDCDSCRARLQEQRRDQRVMESCLRKVRNLCINCGKYTIWDHDVSLCSVCVTDRDILRLYQPATCHNV